MGEQMGRRLVALGLASACGLGAVALAWPHGAGPVPPPTVMGAVSYELATPAADGRVRLAVTYGSSRCFTEYEPRVTESDDVVDVAVTVTHLPNPEQLSCAAVVVAETQEVLLTRPLAGRRITTLGEPLPRGSD